MISRGENYSFSFSVSQPKGRLISAGGIFSCKIWPQKFFVSNFGQNPPWNFKKFFLVIEKKKITKSFWNLFFFWVREQEREVSPQLQPGRKALWHWGDSVPRKTLWIYLGCLHWRAPALFLSRTFRPHTHIKKQYTKQEQQKHIF